MPNREFFDLLVQWIEISSGVRCGGSCCQSSLPLWAETTRRRIGEGTRWRESGTEREKERLRHKETQRRETEVMVARIDTAFKRASFSNFLKIDLRINMSFIARTGSKRAEIKDNKHVLKKRCWEKRGCSRERETEREREKKEIRKFRENEGRAERYSDREHVWDWLIDWKCVKMGKMKNEEISEWLWG